MKAYWAAASIEGILAGYWTANPITVALMKPGFVPNVDTMKVWTDVAAQEVAGAGVVGYAQVVLAGKSAPYTGATDQTDFKANDVVWGPGATFDAAGAVVYDNSGTKPIWELIDFEGTKSVVNGTFTLDFDALGLLYAVPV